MQRDNRPDNRRTTRGSTLVEFAVVLPLLFMLTMGVTDFGRLFFHAITVANAAGTGAFYGAQNNVNAADSDTIEDRATEDAVNITVTSASATQFCECPAASSTDFTSTPTAVSCDLAATPGTCPGGGYGFPAVYVRVDVTENFTTLGPYPGIPSSTTVNRNAFMRVQ